MKVLLFANTGWYLYNFRRSFALALANAGYEVLLISPQDEYGPKLLDLGFNWLPVPMHRRSVNPIRELLLLRWLKRLMQRENVVLMHGFTIKCAIYGSLAARMAGVPARVNAVAGMGYVFTRHSFRARMLRFVASTMMRMALGGTGVRLVLQNPDDLEIFKGSGVMDEGSIRLIPSSGVNCTRFQPLPERVRGDRFRVLLPARLLWDKGLAEYVEASRIVAAQGHKIDFLLAGNPDPGNPTSVPQTTVEGWVKAGLVKWLGHVDDMAALFKTVDAVVLPSYREGLPKGLIEAGASGLPVVTTDVPGCRDVVTNGVDGLLVPVRNAVLLANAIVVLRDDPAMCARLGNAARLKALDLFDENTIISRTMALYTELLPQRSSTLAIP